RLVPSQLEIRHQLELVVLGRHGDLKIVPQVPNRSRDRSRSSVAAGARSAGPGIRSNEAATDWELATENWKLGPGIWKLAPIFSSARNTRPASGASPP